MAEEHGYQRSGKKCREKFENLYKYYKKTKEGKAGRQDGKHYRFFRQLEALCGESRNQLASSAAAETHLVNNTNTGTTTGFLHQSLSFSTTSEFDTSSSENNNDDDLAAIACMMNKQKGLSNCDDKKKKNWKEEVKEFVDFEMRKLFERQDIWMEKMLKTIEDREQERLCREEESTKKEAARLDRIYEFWANERARIEARDVALMEALQNCSGKGLQLSSYLHQIDATTHHRNDGKAENDGIKLRRWTEPEVFSLMQISTATCSRIQDNGAYSTEGQWEEIAEKMWNLGHHRSVDEYKEKLENMNMICSNMAAEGNKKRNENTRISNYFNQHDETINSSSSTSNSYVGSQVHGNCFQLPINEEEHLWNK